MDIIKLQKFFLLNVFLFSEQILLKLYQKIVKICAIFNTCSIRNIILRVLFLNFINFIFIYPILIERALLGKFRLNYQ